MEIPRSVMCFWGRRAVSLIDLDTCNRHTLLVDLGDAIRSWCRDDMRTINSILLDRFEAMMRGYAAEGPRLAHRGNRTFAGAAGRLITMELASNLPEMSWKTSILPS